MTLCIFRPESCLSKSLEDLSALAEKIFGQISSACRRIDVAFCGGHTEIAVGIDRPMVIGTMLGEVEKNRLITTR